MNKVLITGVAGFLGRYVARHFHKLGWQVVGTDACAEENAPREYIGAYLAANLPCERFGEWISQQQPTLLVHCAGRASVALSMTDPESDFRGNTVLTFHLLESIRVHVPECKFVFFSSAAVYGNPEALPVTESSSIRPLSPYGFHKRQAELACEEFAVVHGLRTACLRIFSAYGPGLRRQVVWDVADKICSPGSLVLRGTGEESRDFIHARDIARAVGTLVETAPLDGECYNLASGEEVRIDHLALTLRDLLGSTKEITFDGKRPQGTPTRWQADITKIRNLGFEPTCKLNQGLTDYVGWAQHLLKN